MEIRRRTVRLLSPLTLSSCQAALQAAIDGEKRAFLFLSGYAGSQAVIGETNGVTFRIHKRRLWKNDFAPHFYGEFATGTNGTSIQGFFDASPFVKQFMRGWIGFVAVVGIPFFLVTVWDLLTGSNYVQGEKWLGIIIPPAMLVWGVLLPKVGRLISESDETFLVEFLETSLAAKKQDSVLTAKV